MAAKNKKELLIEEIKLNWESFISELGSYFSFIPRGTIDVEDISVFGAYGFDDSCVYSNSFYGIEVNKFNKIVEMAEEEYLANDKLVEAFNGVTQCIIEVEILDGKVKITNFEKHIEIFEKAKIACSDEISSITFGGDWLWFDTKDGYNYKIYNWHRPKSNKLNDIKKVIESEIISLKMGYECVKKAQSSAGPSEGWVSFSTEDESGYIWRETDEWIDYALIKFVEDNLESIAKAWQNDERATIGPERESIFMDFNSLEEVENFKKKTNGTRITISRKN